MSTWDTAYNASPDDSDQASTLGLRDRETRTDIYDRMIRGGFEWESDSDGGKIKYLRGLQQSSDPTLGGTDAALYFKLLRTDAPTTPVYMDDSGTIRLLAPLEAWNAEQYGAVGDGATDSAAAIQAAIDAASAAGGGTVFIPPGNYIIEASLIIPSDVSIIGAGVRATVLTAKAGLNNTVLNATGTGISGIEIAHLEIDGQRASQTAGHGIRVDDLGAYTYLHHLYVHDTYDYGIGLEAATNSAGTVWIDTVHIKNTGMDCIDVKDPDETLEGVFISNAFLESPNLGGTTTSGVDARGPCLLTDIYVKLTEPGSMGIRCRQQGSATGNYGRRAVITGFHVSGSADSTRGVAVFGRRCQVSNGFISLTGASTIGVELINGGGTYKTDWNTVRNVHIADADTGISLASDAENNVVENVRTEGVTTAYADDGQKNALLGFHFRDPTTGLSFTAACDDADVQGGVIVGGSITDAVLVASGAAGIRIRDVDFRGTITDYIDDSGTDTDVQRVTGIPWTSIGFSGTSITVPTGVTHVRVTGTGTLRTINGNEMEGYRLYLNFAGVDNIDELGNIRGGSLSTNINDGLILVYDAGSGVWRSMGGVA